MGGAKWGNLPHARMSLLSVLSIALFMVVLVIGAAAKHSGSELPDRVGGWFVLGSFALTCRRRSTCAATGD
jgi:hypothetical protein